MKCLGEWEKNNMENLCCILFVLAGLILFISLLISMTPGEEEHGFLLSIPGWIFLVLAFILGEVFL